jgi:hypothetical protein
MQVGGARTLAEPAVLERTQHGDARAGCSRDANADADEGSRNLGREAMTGFPPPLPTFASHATLRTRMRPHRRSYRLAITTRPDHGPSAESYAR